MATEERGLVVSMLVDMIFLRDNLPRESCVEVQFASRRRVAFLFAAADATQGRKSP